MSQKKFSFLEQLDQTVSNLRPVNFLVNTILEKIAPHTTAQAYDCYHVGYNYSNCGSNHACKSNFNGKDGKWWFDVQQCCYYPSGFSCSYAYSGSECCVR